MPHQQILEAWQRWRTVAARKTEWQRVALVAPVGEREGRLLKRLELAERAIQSLQLLWSADYQKEYARDWQALIEDLADWQAARGREQPRQP